MRKHSCIAVLLSLTLVPLGSNAQQYVKSGTGFFISKAGHIITNEHVVRGCDTVKIRGAVNDTEADVIKTDSDIDLALLRTRAIPPRIAPIRNARNEIRVGEKLLVIGYPEKHGQTGIYKITRSKVKGQKGPLGGDQWVQFEDSARQGNSGGPLLDASGNVIGVVMGKAEIIRTNLANGRQEKVGNSDLAISLPYLWNFIKNEQVQTITQDSAVQHGNGYLERMASEYIVNIHCVE